MARRKRGRRHGRRSGRVFENALFFAIASVALLFATAYVLDYSVRLIKSAFSEFEMNEYTGEIFATLFLLAVGVIIFFSFIRPTWAYVKKVILYELDQRRYGGLKHLSRIENMDALTFEKFVGFVLQNEGLRDITFTPMVNDEGIDIFGLKDGKRIAIQVKKYHPENKIGRVSLQNFVGAYLHVADEGWFITSGFFNWNAKHYAKNHPNLRLIDGPDFGYMMGRLPDDDWVKNFIVDPLLPGK